MFLTFVFWVSVEANTVAGLEDDTGSSSVSSMSSTRALFETDEPVVDSEGLWVIFLFLLFKPFECCWWDAGPRSATVLVARLSASWWRDYISGDYNC